MLSAATVQHKSQVTLKQIFGVSLQVQLRHNKRKSAAIKQLLSSAATGELTGASASKAAAMYQSAHVSAETLQDALDELLQTDQSDSEGDHSS